MSDRTPAWDAMAEGAKLRDAVTAAVRDCRLKAAQLGQFPLDETVARAVLACPALRESMMASVDDLMAGAGPRIAEMVTADAAEIITQATAAARHFAETWAELLTMLPDSYDCQMTCAEADAAADLYRALGDDGTAASILGAHAHYDEEGDEHYGQPGPTS